MVTIIENESEWTSFKRELSEEKIQEPGIKFCGHDGDPEEFPCIVTSSFHKAIFRQEGEKYFRAYYKHIFVYEKQANKLLELMQYAS